MDSQPTHSTMAHSTTLRCPANVKQRPSTSEESIINDNAIYILQTITIDNKRYTIFFDLGCSDMVIRERAIRSLGANANLEFDGEVTVGGVGQSSQQSKLGIYKITIPTHNGINAQLSGVCLPEITSPFPVYQIKQVEEDIHRAYRGKGNDPSKLPLLAASAGGEIDIMIGIKYLRYHPKPVFQLPSGLTIYKSAFNNADGGGQGVIGGPHHIFNGITNNNTDTQLQSFLSSQLKMYKSGVLVNPDITLLHNKVEKDHQKNLMYELQESHNVHADALLSRNQKVFDQVEGAGSTISYRCVNCRGCQTCKDSEAIESISIKEEVEQDIINKSVTVDIANRTSWANLPLIQDPRTRLANNRNKALCVYYQQLRKLNKVPSDKDDVIKSQAKLQSMGFVDYVKNLPIQQQDTLRNHNIQNFIPWRAVWKGNSISTPCRVVFDASQQTNTGYSLNDIVAKGTNNMNRLVEILIRWTSHQTAFHTDVSKMYNSVRLHEDHWCLQRYIWQEELDDSKLPEEKVIKTLIYGVKSSGNQAERALRETGQLSKKQYPEVCDVIRKDVYVDDCLSGAESNHTAAKLADELKIVVNRGGFALKGFTFSREPPSTDLSTDGECIHVAGMRWFPEEDTVSLDVTELNFAKKSRGKKPASSNQIPSKLTRRHCVSKVAELYDITGKITPITAAMKLDLHQLVVRRLDWDDQVPDELRPIWESNFAMMEEISSIRYKRAIVPEDAVSLDIDTIDTGDASGEMACSAIYARFRRKSGGFSCQLVFQVKIDTV